MYIVIAFMFKSETNWSKNQLFSVLVASVIPFGTFYIDRKYLKTTN
jgi:integral membrane protein